MSRLYKSAELFANIAIILAAVTLSSVLIKQHLHSQPASEYPEQRIHPFAFRSEGGHLDLPNVDWAKNGQTIVLALSSSCPYCTKSAPFYKRLMTEANIRPVFVMPEGENSGRQYLNDLGISASDVRQLPLQSIGVAGTPTMLLVNSAGVVTDSWVGILSPEREAEVLSRIKASRASR